MSGARISAEARPTANLRYAASFEKRRRYRLGPDTNEPIHVLRRGVAGVDSRDHQLTGIHADQLPRIARDTHKGVIFFDNLGLIETMLLPPVFRECQTRADRIASVVAILRAAAGF